MLKMQAVLEVSKEDKVYTLSFPAEAPLGELHDALFQMRSFVVEKVNSAIEAEKPKGSGESTLEKDG